MADMLNLKKWVGCWITSRSGWLLELLTELTKTSKSLILMSSFSDGEIYEFMKLFLSGKTKFKNHLSIVSAQFATFAVPLVEF